MPEPTRNTLRGQECGQDAVVRDIRQRIIAGEYAPATHLPTRRELADQYGVSLTTAQRAMHQLTGEQFVVGRRRAGTWVHPQPPHLWHYGLVFPRTADTSKQLYSRFWVSLINAAQTLESQSDRRIRLFYLQGGRPDENDGAALERAVVDHRLAGLTLVGTNVTTALRDTPVMRTPGMPRVALKTGALIQGLDAVVETDSDAWVERAMKAVAERGCRRPALVTISPAPGEAIDRAAATARRHGLKLGPTDVLPIDPRVAEWARYAIQLFFRNGPEHWPDAIIVDDDNVLEPITIGLLEIGVPVPDRLFLVGQCNFAARQPALLPATRLGFDDCRLLQTCLDLIDQRRREQHIPPRTFVQPIFESELSRAASGTPDTAAADASS